MTGELFLAAALLGVLVLVALGVAVSYFKLLDAIDPTRRATAAERALDSPSARSACPVCEPDAWSFAPAPEVA